MPRLARAFTGFPDFPAEICRAIDSREKSNSAGNSSSGSSAFCRTLTESERNLVTWILPAYSLPSKKVFVSNN